MYVQQMPRQGSAHDPTRLLYARQRNGKRSFPAHPRHFSNRLAGLWPPQRAQTSLGGGTISTERDVSTPRQPIMLPRVGRLSGGLTAVRWRRHGEAGPRLLSASPGRLLPGALTHSALFGPVLPLTKLGASPFQTGRRVRTVHQRFQPSCLVGAMTSSRTQMSCGI